MLTVIIFSLVGGLFSLLGGIALLSSKKRAQQVAKYATPFAAGALLAAAFLDLLQEALQHAIDSNGSIATVLQWTLIGILFFFMLERVLDWFHHHHQHKNSKHDPSARLVVIGDTLHNALDGVAIAAAFLISTPAGIITTIAVSAHEIPQEIGDFGLLLSKGYSRKRVLVVNALSALSTTLAAVITYIIGDANKLPVPSLLAIVAGFFIYIAASDIIPSIHEQVKGSRLLNIHTMLLLLGVVVITFTTALAHNYTDHHHDAVCPSSQEHMLDDHNHSDDILKEKAAGINLAQCLPD